MELLPLKATFSPEEPVEIEVRGAHGPTAIGLWHLDRQLDVKTTQRDEGLVRFPPQPIGGYGVEADDAQTALDVLADPLDRPRYGFVSHYEAGRETDGVVDNIRRLHLNATQFYDWMFRHAQLLPPDEEFTDALGRQISLNTVRRLAKAVDDVGSLPIGYAAVYTVGREHWDEWRRDGLYRSDGSPWTLGDDFLWNVDPTSHRWLDHFIRELQAARNIGFAGFHLDQYGSPKRALRRDGSKVDLAAAFPALIDTVAARVPGTRLIFNNVNDFPTWTTAGAKQDAVYIEVWPPHDRLTHLAELVTKAKSLAPDKPVILAAYLSAYARDGRGAAAAEQLQLATVFSHGGTVLLHGEEEAALTEAYYVSHKRLDAESQASARRYFDFAVRYGDLLFDRGAVDVTRTHAGGDNQEVKLSGPVPVGTDCEPGTLWMRVIQTDRGLLISLIDLTSQEDERWDAPKTPSQPLSGLQLSVERATSGTPSFLFGAPDDAPRLQRLDAELDGSHDRVVVPPFRTWAIIWVRDG